MTPAAQRIAIAEFCGWTDIKDCSCKKVPRGTHAASDREGHLPDYLADLNEMNAAEKVLTDVQSTKYWKLLSKLVNNTIGNNFDNQFECVHATAAQRAEAFLRTINKWHETR